MSGGSWRILILILASHGGGQIIDEKAIADDGGSAVTIAANTPLFIVENGIPVGG